MSKFIVSLSPHAHGTDSVERNMYGVIIALVPALLVSLYYFGIGSAVVLATSVAACVFFEWAISKYLMKREPSISDGSAILTGLLLAFNLPSNLPICSYWHWQDDFRRTWMQSFQSCSRGKMLLAGFFPRTNDFMAIGWTIGKIY